ncbi:MAG: DinB family protein [Spirochaetia bacterium]|jgi:hypothetical protein|nr:DinB family protein [Spirochaetia bacterium]
MFSVAKDWNPKQKRLALLLSKPQTFADAISLCLEMHNQVHGISDNGSPTIYKNLITDLTAEMITYRPENDSRSIAWNLWHITRIEDAVSNILIDDSKQVLNSEWLDRMQIDVTDTGNAFTKENVDEFDQAIDTSELLNYRKAVGKNTQTVLKKLSIENRKRKPTKGQLDRILSEGVLTQEKDSIWLLEFWGKKTMTGLLTMPITRHQILHLNKCFKLKERYRKDFR